MSTPDAGQEMVPLREAMTNLWFGLGSGVIIGLVVGLIAGVYIQHAADLIPNTK